MAVAGLGAPGGDGPSTWHRQAPGERCWVAARLRLLLGQEQVQAWSFRGYLHLPHRSIGSWGTLLWGLCPEPGLGASDHGGRTPRAPGKPRCGDRVGRGRKEGTWHQAVRPGVSLGPRPAVAVNTEEALLSTWKSVLGTRLGVHRLDWVLVSCRRWPGLRMAADWWHLFTRTFFFFGLFCLFFSPLGSE